MAKKRNDGEFEGTPPPGHNSVKSGADDGQFGGPILRQFFDRIQRLNEEIAALNQDKSQVFSEVKAHGFDLPTFRTVLSRAQQDRSAVVQRDALVDMYEEAIFGKPVAETEGEG